MTSGSEVDQLFGCIVCGRAWPKKQSLRAHMKVHKREGYFRTSVIAIRSDWEQFKQICKSHKTTSCRVLGQMVKAINAGEKQGIVTIASPNPVVIQVNDVVVGAARGRYSHYDGKALLNRLEDPGVKLWPPSCDQADVFFKSSREVGCLKSRDTLSLTSCWICWNSRSVNA